MTSTSKTTWSKTEPNYKSKQDFQIQKIEDQIAIFKQQIAFLIQKADESVQEKKYLKKHRRGWYVRVAVPSKVAKIIKKKHIVKSLKTRDLAKARNKRWTVVHAIKNEIESLKVKIEKESKMNKDKLYQELDDAFEELTINRKRIKDQLDSQEISETDYYTAFNTVTSIFKNRVTCANQDYARGRI